MKKEIDMIKFEDALFWYDNFVGTMVNFNISAIGSVIDAIQNLTVEQVKDFVENDVFMVTVKKGTSKFQFMATKENFPMVCAMCEGLAICDTLFKKPDFNQSEVFEQLKMNYTEMVSAIWHSMMTDFDLAIHQYFSELKDEYITNQIKKIDMKWLNKAKEKLAKNL